MDAAVKKDPQGKGKIADETEQHEFSERHTAKKS